MPSARGKLSRGELVELGYGPRTERYFAPSDPRADAHGTISRRQAENERYTAGGWSSRAQYERRYEGAAGRKYARFEQEAQRQGKIGARGAKPGDEYARLFNAWRKTGFKESGKTRTPAAKFLRYVGLKTDESYPVGSTPPRK